MPVRARVAGACLAVALTWLPGAAATAAVVPFVGCAGTGQTGPVEAPHGEPRTVALEPAAAAQLAHYEALDGPSVLAPVGWACIAFQGSAGATLLVAPGLAAGPDAKPPTGPAVVARIAFADTSGAFEVAGYLARLFPRKGRAFVNRLEERGIASPATHYVFKPYPKDHLTYRNGDLVAFETPANAVGLGSTGLLRPSALRSRGFVAYREADAVLHVLVVRLPAAQQSLAPAIVDDRIRAIQNP